MVYYLKNSIETRNFNGYIKTLPVGSVFMKINYYSVKQNTPNYQKLN